MKLKKSLVSVAVIGSMSLLTACDGDEGDVTTYGATDNSTLNVSGDYYEGSNSGSGATGGGTGTGISDCPSWATSLIQDASGNDQCELPGSIQSDVTLTSDKVWILDEPTLVGNGNGDLDFTDLSSLNNVILTIDAGTRVKANASSYLVITRGSQIRANGTAANPIVMSGSQDDDPTNGSGEWGGIVLQGFGANNNCPTGTSCNVNGEGNLVDFKWGGFDNTDSSGVMTYVIVTEAGFEVSPDNELNGIGFMGVGSGTTVNHIQVHNNQDDGVEFWGGAVNVSHLVLTNNQDDSIDWDEGYQGNIQFAIVKHDATNGGDHGIEADNGGPSNTATPTSKPTLANVTFVGAGASSDDAFMFKKGTGAFIHNTVVSGFADCLNSDDTDVTARIGSELVLNNVILDCSANVYTGLSTSGLYASQSISEVAASLSGYASTAAAASLAGNVDFTQFPATTQNTADSSFLVQTNYAGAVNPAGSDDWYSSWTLTGSL